METEVLARGGVIVIMGIAGVATVAGLVGVIWELIKND